jgi:hypothetical protein
MTRKDRIAFQRWAKMTWWVSAPERMTPDMTHKRGDSDLIKQRRKWEKSSIN